MFSDASVILFKGRRYNVTPCMTVDLPPTPHGDRHPSVEADPLEADPPLQVDPLLGGRPPWRQTLHPPLGEEKTSLLLTSSGGHYSARYAS